MSTRPFTAFTADPPPVREMFNIRPALDLAPGHRVQVVAPPPGLPQRPVGRPTSPTPTPPPTSTQPRRHFNTVSGQPLSARERLQIELSEIDRTPHGDAARLALSTKIRVRNMDTTREAGLRFGSTAHQLAPSYSGSRQSLGWRHVPHNPTEPLGPIQTPHNGSSSPRKPQTRRSVLEEVFAPGAFAGAGEPAPGGALAGGALAAGAAAGAAAAVAETAASSDADPAAASLEPRPRRRVQSLLGGSSVAGSLNAGVVEDDSRPTTSGQFSEAASDLSRAQTPIGRSRTGPSTIELYGEENILSIDVEELYAASASQIDAIAAMYPLPPRERYSVPPLPPHPMDQVAADWRHAAKTARHRRRNRPRDPNAFDRMYRGDAPPKSARARRHSADDAHDEPYYPRLPDDVCENLWSDTETLPASKRVAKRLQLLKEQPYLRERIVKAATRHHARREANLTVDFVKKNIGRFAPPAPGPPEAAPARPPSPGPGADLPAADEDRTYRPSEVLRRKKEQQGSLGGAALPS